MAPHAKVGGLGDVVTGLAKACLARGHNVEIMLPYYECLPNDAIEDLRHERDFDCPKGKTWDGVFQAGNLRTQVYTGKIEGCPVILIRPDWNESNLFRGGRIYGGSYNEAEAYLYFSRACLEYLRQSGRQPDVVHVHEWQASAVPMLFWDAPARFSQDMPRTRVVMTIHNFDSSGECRQDEFSATGVSGELYSTIDKALDERTIGHNPERLCLLKGGIVYSNAVTTVSPNYANETLNGGAAGWLKSTLATPGVAVKYSGVLNGIDTDFWDPTHDPFLPACYSPQQQEGKALCKRFLQMGLGMTVDPDKPLVAVISRLVPQKGIHLIEHAVHRTIELGGQFVVLGTGHADSGLRNLAGGQYRDNPDVQMRFMYSEALAHQIYAAADMLLVPSMFEPCGLTQVNRCIVLLTLRLAG
jgi:starch synthase